MNTIKHTGSKTSTDRLSKDKSTVEAASPGVETSHEMSTARFEPGTFTPRPKRAPIGRLVAAQGWMETKLFLRHGEQQLLSLVIPIVMLVGLRFMPFVQADHPIGRLFPMVLSVALMSAGFTGQAIAVVFDRRYGALKRMGASALPSWAIIVGKIIAVTAAVVVQAVILGIIASVLGFSTSWIGLVYGVIFLLVGIATFTSLGLLLGGTLGSEVVLALGNLLWFALMGCAAIVSIEPTMSESVHTLLMLVPSVELTQGMIDGFAGSFNFSALALLLVWSVVSALAAIKLFKFTD